ncbi:hypothetical protein [Amycolatopsis sp.]|uniref:hypothetical protein n=1 Tax=Amycolatopsis sp. TaxID=37632 RepID=UPI002D0424FE|nr:hypothetical protein [Amycolatopsis sp.]HVV08734.1 hypothetical protein [Amycolatopsis sp.]
MLSQSSPDIHPERTGRSTRRVIGLTGELADALSDFDAGVLTPGELRELMRGMNSTASALTRILDRLRERPELVGREPGQYPSLHTELDQAAAAAEDLQVTAASLARLLPTQTLASAGALAPARAGAGAVPMSVHGRAR